MNIIAEYLSQFYEELEPKEFYRIVFPKGELDQKGAMTKGKYTGIIIEVTDKKKKTKKIYKDGTSRIIDMPIVYRHSITDSLDEIDDVLKSNNFCLTPPLSYAGKERKSENARFLYAIAIDVDKIKIKGNIPEGVCNMFSQIERAGVIPRPTMIVASGTGMHLYYVFENPIPLFPNIAKELQKYKHSLTEKCWNNGITTIKNGYEIQYEGIYQGFRMPGTITKQGKIDGNNERARCFRIGDKVTIEYMNEFVEDKYKMKETFYKRECTKNQANELYPEWYEKRIVDGYKGVLRPWKLNRSVYDWWINTIYSKIEVGHRFWSLWILSIYAKKCSFYDEKKNPNPVTREELEKDAWELLDYLDSLTKTEDNHFTEIDVIDALEAFEDDFISYPKNSIRYKANIPFEPSIPRREKGKRLKQEDHLEEARAIRDIRMKRKGKRWQDGNGRPIGSKDKKPRESSKAKIIKEYLKEHPEATKKQIKDATGLTYPTIRKWYDQIKNKLENN